MKQKCENRMIVQYLRDRKRQVHGALIAIRSEDEVLIGWGLIHPKDTVGMTVREIKDAAIDTAIGRAIKKRSLVTIEVPVVIRQNLDRFYARANKYFTHNGEHSLTITIGYPAPVQNK